MRLFNTLADALDERTHGDKGIGFIDGANDERYLSYRALSRAAMQRLAVLQDRGLQPGDRLVLFVDDTQRFAQFFWAAVYGGIVPVPIAAGTSDANLQKLTNVWTHLGEPRVVTSPRYVERGRAYLQTHGGEPAAERLASSVLSDEPPLVDTAAVRARLAPDDTAFIQFSSGATGDPKGVVLTHANVLANLRGIARASRFAANETALSWMPLTHDMGLIGFHLGPIYNGFTHYLMATDLFARRPLLWLEKAAEKQATLLCSPNFGLGHTRRAIAAKGLPAIDLSAVRLIYNGAEPIAAPLARGFLADLAPTGLAGRAMFPVYGLAEASLAVTFGRPGDGLRTQQLARGGLGMGDRVRFDASQSSVEIVNLGRPVAGTQLCIADADGRALAEDTVGRVWIRGDNVTGGYVDNQAANRAARVGDGWLDTGDLGFIHGGDLLVTGRAKEIIFVNGQNHYPQDIEAAVQDGAGLELNKIAAVGVRSPGADADELVVFAVFRGHVEDFVPIARRITAQLNQRTGLSLARAVPVERLPKTTSGKLQRSALARAYAQGEFAEVGAELDRLLWARATRPTDTGGAPTVAAQLQSICDEIAPDYNIGASDDLFEIGLSSLELAQIHEAIEQRWPDRLELTDLFDYPNINALAVVLDESKAA